MTSQNVCCEKRLLDDVSRGNKMLKRFSWKWSHHPPSQPAVSLWYHDIGISCWPLHLDSTVHAASWFCSVFLRPFCPLYVVGCTECFILKIDRMFYAVPVSDFLPGSICSVQLDAASIKNRLGAYFKWSREERHFWDSSETFSAVPECVLYRQAKDWSCCSADMWTRWSS